MVEPTESESLIEMTRFVDALVDIRKDIQEIEDGNIAYGNSVLAHAPHPQEVATMDVWDRSYSREKAVFPLPFVRYTGFASLTLGTALTTPSLALTPNPHPKMPRLLLSNSKHWPETGRIDNVYGDRHLFCSCPPVEDDSPVQAEPTPTKFDKDSI